MNAIIFIAMEEKAIIKAVIVDKLEQRVIDRLRAVRKWGEGKLEISVSERKKRFRIVTSNEEDGRLVEK